MKTSILLAASLAVSTLGLAQSYDFESLTSGATGNFSNGWTGSPTSGYSWRADAGGTTSSGTGPNVDHTTGAATGIYMYTEASTPATTGNVAYLTSPSLNLTSLTNPGMLFWYHRAGTNMGNMYIDVNIGSGWVLGIDSLVGTQQATETSAWLSKRVNLSGYGTANTQIRFRAEYADGWSGDMAIDDVSMIDLPAYDAQILSVRSPNVPYYNLPLEQIQAVDIETIVRNEGAQSVTNLQVNATIGGNTQSTTGTTLAGFSNDTITLSSAFTPTGNGVYNPELYVSVSQNDTFPNNDSASMEMVINDSVYSRDNGAFTGGIGFTGATGEFGQMFEVYNTDTLTSVSVFLDAPTSGGIVRIKLYNYTTVPTTVIDSTNSLPVGGSSTWLEFNFGCPLILTPGKYFFSAVQTTTNNLSLGYSTFNYDPQVCWYDGGAGWTDFETAGFQVSLGIRPNFGNTSFPDVQLGNDTSFCQGGIVTLDAGPGFDSYKWTNVSTGYTINTQTITTFASGVFEMVVTDNKGCTDVDTQIVVVNPIPIIPFGSNTKICSGESATLVAGNDSTATYTWSTGETTNTISVNTTGTYWVHVESAAGCENSDTIDVVPGNLPTVEITASAPGFCEGDSLELSTFQNNNYTYIWSNGENSNAIVVSAGGTYEVTVSSGDGCEDTDEFIVTEYNNPVVDLGADSLFCEEDLETGYTFNIGSFDTYLWSDGSTGTNLTINTADTVWVEITDMNGCSGSDTIVVTTQDCYNSVDELAADFDIKVYPNPTRDILNLSWSNELAVDGIEIYTVHGQRVIQTQTNAATQVAIDLGQLSNGVYFVEFKRGDEEIYQARIVKH